MSEEKKDAKGDFATILVHQLRTPLAGIKWTLSGVLKGDLGPLNDEQMKVLEKCYEDNDNTIAIVNDILSLDTLKSGKFQYNYEETQVVDLISNIVTSFLPLAERYGIDLVFETEGLSLPPLVVDPNKIHTILQNLIENAVTYSKPGTKISVKLVPGKDEFTVSVSDQGIGISKEEQPKIFSEFFRAKNAIKQRRDGIGLGLYIIKNVLEGQGGKIWFESEEGKGTTFFFTIPTNKTVS
ncbi:MAG: HAMP domain-containing sensor histidine kinase [Candidatus Pacebacteria bacterium]|nr:HAMP domain-containing sensor histidine kinase [Candidatus Paceibacterota bacterium]MDD5357211.1 HAMP domain-containing sensor histidine kinase [Candidatus Paceibacterota bacterium]